MLKKWWQNRAKMRLRYTDYMGRDTSLIVGVGTQFYNAHSLYGSGMTVTHVLPRHSKLELNFDFHITRDTLISRLRTGQWYPMCNREG